LCAVCNYPRKPVLITLSAVGKSQHISFFPSPYSLLPYLQKYFYTKLCFLCFSGYICGGLEFEKMKTHTQNTTKGAQYIPIWVDNRTFGDIEVGL